MSDTPLISGYRVGHRPGGEYTPPTPGGAQSFHLLRGLPLDITASALNRPQTINFTITGKPQIFENGGIVEGRPTNMVYEGSATVTRQASGDYFITFDVQLAPGASQDTAEERAMPQSWSGQVHVPASAIDGDQLVLRQLPFSAVENTATHNVTYRFAGAPPTPQSPVTASSFVCPRPGGPTELDARRAAARLGQSYADYLRTHCAAPTQPSARPIVRPPVTVPVANAIRPCPQPGQPDTTARLAAARAGQSYADYLRAYCPAGPKASTPMAPVARPTVPSSLAICPKAGESDVPARIAAARANMAYGTYLQQRCGVQSGIVNGPVAPAPVVVQPAPVVQPHPPVAVTPVPPAPVAPATAPAPLPAVPRRYQGYIAVLLSGKEHADLRLDSAAYDQAVRQKYQDLTDGVAARDIESTLRQACYTYWVEKMQAKGIWGGDITQYTSYEGLARYLRVNEVIALHKKLIAYQPTTVPVVVAPAPVRPQPQPAPVVVAPQPAPQPQSASVVIPTEAKPYLAILHPGKEADQRSRLDTAEAKAKELSMTTVDALKIDCFNHWKAVLQTTGKWRPDDDATVLDYDSLAALVGAKGKDPAAIDKAVKSYKPAAKPAQPAPADPAPTTIPDAVLPYLKALYGDNASVNQTEELAEAKKFFVDLGKTGTDTDLVEYFQKFCFVAWNTPTIGARDYQDLATKVGGTARDPGDVKRRAELFGKQKPVEPAPARPAPDPQPIVPAPVPPAPPPVRPDPAPAQPAPSGKELRIGDITAKDLESAFGLTTFDGTKFSVLLRKGEASRDKLKLPKDALSLTFTWELPSDGQRMQQAAMEDITKRLFEEVGALFTKTYKDQTDTAILVALHPGDMAVKLGAQRANGTVNQLISKAFGGLPTTVMATDFRNILPGHTFYNAWHNTMRVEFVICPNRNTCDVVRRIFEKTQSGIMQKRSGDSM